MAQNIKTISADDFEAVAATVQRYVGGRRTQHVDRVGGEIYAVGELPGQWHYAS
ncbi:hypothetical protein [Ensifer sp. ENS11]|uniref:hypothetical protein n=1 Tax=Ensifer sp. ENS11 TaxID=2769291 RepID=UPI001786A749|nr:hypothetical protein [Ensifer sp. ENS11]MBD9487997.1 hypothetical protein [Ensifer sp. ENS11]